MNLIKTTIKTHLIDILIDNVVNKMSNNLTTLKGIHEFHIFISQTTTFIHFKLDPKQHKYARIIIRNHEFSKIDHKRMVCSRSHKILNPDYLDNQIRRYQLGKDTKYMHVKISSTSLPELVEYIRDDVIEVTNR